MSLPKISIITPSFNQGAYLGQTIQSVLQQGYPNLEYIIVDGGSTDDSVAIIRKYAPQLHYWVSEPDRGQSDALLKGFEKATGDIIAWLNSDDWYAPGTLMAVATVWQQNNGFDVLHGDAGFYFEGRPNAGFNTAYGHCNLQRLLHYWVKGRHCNPPQPSVFMRKSLLDQLGFVDPRYHLAMDYDLWLRLMLNGAKFQYLPMVMSYYRFHDASKSGTRAGFSHFYGEWHQVFLKAIAGLPLAKRLWWAWFYAAHYRGGRQFALFYPLEYLLKGPILKPLY